MKKSTKKILVILSSCLLSCSAAALAGCENPFADNGGTTGGVTPQASAYINFTVSEKTMTIGDEEYLLPNYEKLIGYTLTYASSDPSVVQVDEFGKLTAVREGSVTVTAKYSNGEKSVSASVLVNSSFSGYLPELKTVGVANDISITLDSSYLMQPYISFNDKQFNDMTVTYSILDNAVAEVTAEGEIIAKAKGTTKLIIEAEWRGKDKTNAPTLQKQVSLSVIDDVRFFNGGKTVSDEGLFVLGEFDGVSYRNTMPCVFTAEVNGVETLADVEIEDENIVERVGNQLVARSYGSTTVTVSKQTADETYFTTFEVNVKRIEKSIASIVPYFSTTEGSYLTAAGESGDLLSFIGESAEAVDAYQNGKPLTVTNGKIYGVASSSESSKGTASVVVGTDKVLYTFNLETYAKVVSKPEDLYSLTLSSGKVLTGYYELIKNLDASAVTMSHTVTNEACFSGVFNGNGYSISNLSLAADQSMFGVLSSSAVVKNLALVNLNATEAFFLAQNTLGDVVTLTDLYISLSEDTQIPRGITGRTAGNSVLKNVVIEYLGENAEANRNYSNSSYKWQGLVGGVWRNEAGLADGGNGKVGARDSKWSDVYVISPFVVSFAPSDFTVNGKKNAAVYGYGANETTDIYGNSLETSVHERENPNLGSYFNVTTYCDIHFANLYHYNSYEALATANKDLSSFSSDYWVVYNNKVVWKSLLANEVTAKLYDGNGEIGDSLRITRVGKEIGVKAFAEGSEVTDLEVKVSENGYLAWDSDNKVLKVTKIPASATAVTVEIKITVKVGNAQFVKTLKLVLKDSTVQPIQPGGDYSGDDYEDPTSHKVQPIQPNGNYNADDYAYENGFVGEN